MHEEQTHQARIQDFEMGGEFLKRNQRNQILFQYLRDKKRKKEGGSEKREGGFENSPIVPPLDPRLHIIPVSTGIFHTF